MLSSDVLFGGARVDDHLPGRRSCVHWQSAFVFHFQQLVEVYQTAEKIVPKDSDTLKDEGRRSSKAYSLRNIKRS